MATFTKKGRRDRYSFLDSRTMSGSRNTGSPDTPCCMNRAYHGCPAGPEGERKENHPVHAEVTIHGVPLYSIELAKKRKTEGWKYVGR